MDGVEGTGKFQHQAAEHYSGHSARIEKVNYSHDAMIDMIVADPGITQNRLAEMFGYSVGWVSRVIGSDAFQAALSERRKEIADPFLIASIEERMKGLAMQSIDVLVKKLESATPDANLALKGLDIATKALGFGARDRGPANVQNNFVVALPGKVENAADWARKYSPEPRQIVDAIPISSNISRDPLIQPESMKIAEE